MSDRVACPCCAGAGTLAAPGLRPETPVVEAFPAPLREVGARYGVRTLAELAGWTAADFRGRKHVERIAATLARAGLRFRLPGEAPSVPVETALATLRAAASWAGWDDVARAWPGLPHIGWWVGAVAAPPGLVVRCRPGTRIERVREWVGGSWMGYAVGVEVEGNHA